MSPKQSIVLQWFNSHDELTLKQAVELIGGNIYCNQAFYVANILRNMERKKMLGKVKREYGSPPRWSQLWMSEPLCHPCVIGRRRKV